MSVSSKAFFEALSQYCYVTKTPLLFHKNAAKLERHQKGKLQAYEWIDALCFYYLKKERNLKNDFLLLLEEHRRKIEAMTPSAYRDGLLEAIDDIEKKIETIAEDL
jgi:hypothetical protein